MVAVGPVPIAQKTSLNICLQLVVGLVWSIFGRLCGCPGLEYPVDYPAPVVRDFSCNIVVTGVTSSTSAPTLSNHHSSAYTMEADAHETPA